MKEYTAVCITRMTRELIGKLAVVERRTLSQIVALAVEARYRMRLKSPPSSSAKLEEPRP